MVQQYEAEWFVGNEVPKVALKIKRVLQVRLFYFIIVLTFTSLELFGILKCQRTARVRPLRRSTGPCWPRR